MDSIKIADIVLPTCNNRVMPSLTTTHTHKLCYGEKMASFDVFIKGIQPDKLDNAEQIKEKLGKYLKVESSQVEALWLNKAGGHCIRRDVSSEEAQKIQATLVKGGVICTYKPATVGISLALVEEKYEIVKKTFECPKCKHKIDLEEDQPEPDKCEKCFLDVRQYRETLKLKEEREAIKKKLLVSKSAEEQRLEQQKAEEAERKRRQALEEEIREEIYGKDKFLLRKRMVAGGGALTVLIVVGIGYYIYESAMDKAGAACIALDSSRALGTSKVNPSGTEGQQALKTTHDQANKVLGAFGLDADKFASNIKGNDGNIKKTVSISPTTAKADEDAPPAALSPQVVDGVTAALLQDGKNDQEWDLFLNQQAIRLIGRNDLEQAYELAQYIDDTEDYINTLTQILAGAKQSNQTKLLNNIPLAIETRINKLPVTEQAIYLAQAGFYQQKISQKNDLLLRADTVWQQIKTPEDKIKAAVKIASYNYKAGNMEATNMYFQKVPSLLESISSVDQQVIARTAMAKAYSDVNEVANASKWLSSVDPLLPQVNMDTLRELIAGHAYTGSMQTAAVLAHVPPEKRPELLYHAIKVALKNNATETAQLLKKDLQNPIYLALANDLIASYDPNVASFSMDSAEKQLATITLPTDKAIVAGRLARHYARLGNQKKAAELSALAEAQLSSLAASGTTDNVLAIIARNYAQALQFDGANAITSRIAAESAKAQLLNDISAMVKIGDLLK
jgi:hypothetical protein